MWLPALSVLSLITLSVSQDFPVPDYEVCVSYREPTEKYIEEWWLVSRVTVSWESSSPGCPQPYKTAWVCYSLSGRVDDYRYFFARLVDDAVVKHYIAQYGTCDHLRISTSPGPRPGDSKPPPSIFQLPGDLGLATKPCFTVANETVWLLSPTQCKEEGYDCKMFGGLLQSMLVGFYGAKSRDYVMQLYPNCNGGYGVVVTLAVLLGVAVCLGVGVLAALWLRHRKANEQRRLLS